MLIPFTLETETLLRSNLEENPETSKEPRFTVFTVFTLSETVSSIQRNYYSHFDTQKPKVVSEPFYITCISSQKIFQVASLS